MADNIDLKGAPWTESEDEVLSRLQVRLLPSRRRARARLLTRLA